MVNLTPFAGARQAARSASEIALQRTSGSPEPDLAALKHSAEIITLRHPEDGAALNADVATLDREVRELAKIPTSRQLESSRTELIHSVDRLEARFDNLEHSEAADLIDRSRDRIWRYGILVPGSCLLAFLALMAVVLFPALMRIRKINRLLIENQQKAEKETLMLERQNLELQERQSEFVMKTDQLEGASVSSQIAARRFEELFQGLPVACVGFSRDGLIYEWNRASSELFGREAFEVFHTPVWVHIADRAFRRRSRKLMERLFEGEEIRDIQWSFLRKEDERRYVLGSLFPMRGLDGKIQGGVAACLDVTDRHEAERRVRKSEQLFRELLDSLHEGVVVYDCEGSVVVGNRQASRLLGIDQAKLAEDDVTSLYRDAVSVDGEPIQAADLPVCLCQTTGAAVKESTIGVPDALSEGSPIRWLSTNVIPLYHPNAEKPYGVLSSFTDVTERLEQEAQLNSHVIALAAAHQELQEHQQELKAANAQLAALAISDGLTGLFNHRSFQEQLERAVATSADGELSLVLVDVDHFKMFNDDFGHPAGDRVLRDVAKILGAEASEPAVVARYGGEEFAIILPGFGAAEALAFAHNLCSAIASASWRHRQVTISAGVATLDARSVGSPTALIQIADEALYSSKHSGRNRATHADDMRAAA